ncbi:MAG: hypothetical protein ABIJ58_01730 [Nanoarchaeota archaeon]
MKSKKGDLNIEEVFKSIMGIIFFIIFLGALAPLIGASNIFGLSSWLIGLTVMMVILAFLIKILDEFGLLR